MDNMDKKEIIVELLIAAVLESGPRSARCAELERVAKEAREGFLSCLQPIRSRRPHLEIQADEGIFPVIYISGPADDVDAFVTEILALRPTLVKHIESSLAFVIPHVPQST